MKPITRDDLKPFQIRSASRLAEMILNYPHGQFKPRYDPDTGATLPFLSRLRAITGAGKTPILAQTATYLETGVILWTTNRSAVIAQTIANLRPGGKYASLLPESTQVFSLSEMSSTDWNSTMQAKQGITILLATVSSFNKDGDDLKIHRKIGEQTRWEMLGGQGEEGRVRPIFIFYDEGHGVTEKQFTKLRELDPKAFVLASASPLPEDLTDLLPGKTQEEREGALAERTVIVPTKEVVDEGLLKERLYFMDCNTEQVNAIKEANNKWTEISKKLVKHKKRAIASFIVNETIRGVDVWEDLVSLGVPRDKIAVHLNRAKDIAIDRFGSANGLLDTYTGKNPSDRSPEALVQAGYTHIIWNLTLREGWDEPYAYVAYIDSKGKSTIDIVQKIGRFVRQPEAKRFNDPDLNASYFYLNIPDEEFEALLKATQDEMETEGQELIPLTGVRSIPMSRIISVKEEVFVPKITYRFGDNLEERDRALLDNVTLYHEKALQAEGAIKTRVIAMKTLEEDKSLRSNEVRTSNDSTSVWNYLSMRLGNIDSRIVNSNNTIFSADIKNYEIMEQRVRYGSDVIKQLENAIIPISQRLNEIIQLVSMQRSQIQIQSFKMISPNISGKSDLQREKYRVRDYKNAIHAQYNGMNAFEVLVADALDSLGNRWCRNPVSNDSFRLPIPILGADSLWFYPDFILWGNDEIIALDPKGKHLAEDAILNKLLDTALIKGHSTPVRVALILEGNFVPDAQGTLRKNGKSSDGYTLVRRGPIGIKTIHDIRILPLLKKLI
ncbi:DEAD/DEAH box helicase [Deinococcus sp. AJ005]|uniref:DEAD/DEAH box helicase n=1 Tax=Deinococcus sp. AJ005 TaxID=2652443 RepID=UPI00125CC6F0|nr:DEAD/DEAH box helicase family protein [Deinococcus sp. AJ005]QFP75050.1 hypothetical protein DAAJ005_00335 [Deinococcus sp. AJ005]